MKFIILAFSFFIQLFIQDKTPEQIKVEKIVHEWAAQQFSTEHELKFSKYKADYTEEFQLLKMEAANLQDHSVQATKKERKALAPAKSVEQENQLISAEKKMDDKLKNYHPKVMSYQIDAEISFAEDSVITRRFFLNDYFQLTTIRELND